MIDRFINNEFDDDDSISCIRFVCETDKGIKMLFPEKVLHNGIFYAERFVN